MSMVAHSPSHRGEIAELFIREAATLSATLPRSVRSHYDQRAYATSVLFRHSQTWCFCHASATLLAFWPCSSALLKLVSLFWIL